MILVLAAVSGQALTTYQVFDTTQVNVALMTSNLQNIMNNLYRVLFRRDRKAVDDMLHVLSVLLFFMMGAVISIRFVQWNPSSILWISFSLTVLSLLRLCRTQ